MRVGESGPTRAGPQAKFDFSCAVAPKGWTRRRGNRTRTVSSNAQQATDGSGGRTSSGPRLSTVDRLAPRWQQFAPPVPHQTPVRVCTNYRTCLSRLDSGSRQAPSPPSRGRHGPCSARRAPEHDRLSTPDESFGLSRGQHSGTAQHLSCPLHDVAPSAVSSMRTAPTQTGPPPHPRPPATHSLGVNDVPDVR
ncbi:hypothetical protein K466DRAFT_208200 [Polyporus arcularius HHB13444]|uniref:Uncharacterized protein n=1 Tax=Polyporus arcularius HHB13444 TaxID=1314778 RepID=A0A5C3P9P5_9APHY|nr:hypothetical protein K466DRAFT_208200 [Polyporus arcularius HHB13444]